jgi:hypothetical protein
MGAATAKKPRTKSNNRAKMRSSNKVAIEYLIKMGYTDITLRTHCRHKDMVYNKDKIYRATDYWNLFDGSAPIISFCKQYKQKALSVNVKTKIRGKPTIEVREYDEKTT